MNYYCRFTGDYLRDTMHLSLAEDGAYNRLLDWCYTTEKPLPCDRLLIYRLMRANTDSDKQVIDRVIEEFFLKRRWGYINKRAEEEIKRNKKRIYADIKNGKKGGRPPKNKETQTKPSGFQNDNPEKRPPSPSPSPSLKSNTTPPYPPADAGGNKSKSSSNEEQVQVNCWGGPVVVFLPRGRRLWSEREKTTLAGSRADEMVRFFEGKGFRCGLLQRKEAM